MSEQKIDALLKATLFNDAIYPVDQTDDAETTLAHPWADAPIAKAGQQFDDGSLDIEDVVSLLVKAAERAARPKRDIATEGRHDATAHFLSVNHDLEIIDRAWEELLGGRLGDSKKKIASGELGYKVGGELLSKSEITSRMLGVLAQIREFCEGREAELVEKAIRALDFIAFGELVSPVLARMKRAA
jgi:hypothetical protein